MFIFSGFAFYFTIVSASVVGQFRIFPESNLIEDGVLKYQEQVQSWLDEVSESIGVFNALSAEFTWDMAVGNEVEESKIIELVQVRNEWRNKICSLAIDVQYLTQGQTRMLYLLCRGPHYGSQDAIEYLKLQERMTLAYNTDVCLDNNTLTALEVLKKVGQEMQDSYPPPGSCLQAEPDLERLMKRNDLNADQLEWLWRFWHDSVGPKIKEFYPSFMNLQNKAAVGWGYNDMGETWREELEIDDLENTVFDMYEQVKPLYELLHAVVRHKLYLKYGKDIVDPRGSIPVHLLGNMWGQDWSSLSYLFMPNVIDFDKRMLSKNWTVHDMVLQAEDMFASWGLPRMTDKFWKYSVIENQQNLSSCHGTAANMFRRNDYRMLLCAKVNMNDFYVIHHEMGHIQYYMAYSEQPAVFQDGTNTAFHEAIGDVVMHAVLTPQHLNRLGLLSDYELTDRRIDMLLLLKQALSKIPHLPYGLIIDKYRWDIFRGDIKPDRYNRMFWMLNERMRGIIPPTYRDEDFFDAGAKFHVPDNTPYIRYFLSGIIQMDIFKALCEVTLYGKTNKNDSHSGRIPLHKCDVYGSKKIGKRLRKFMEAGSSEKWPHLLEKLTGKNFIDVKPLLQYYRPIYDWLEEYVKTNNVYVGW